jgi:hypothetical protein
MINNHGGAKIAYKKQYRKLCVLFNTFNDMNFLKKKRTMLEIAMIFILNIAYNGHLSNSVMSELSMVYTNRIRYFVRNSKINFGLIRLLYQKSIISFVVMIVKLTGLDVYLIMDDTFVEKDKRSKNIVRGGKKKKKKVLASLQLYYI